MEFLINNKIQYKIFDRTFKDSTHFYSYNDDASDLEVSRNREIIKEYFKADYLYTLKQVHGSEIVIIDENSDENIEIIGDAIITNLPGIAIAVKTADCVPVLLYSDSLNIISAIHCSWRCTKSNIIEKTVKKISEIVNFNELRAIIGPSIKQSSYEVGEEFYDDFANESEDNRRLFKKSLNRYFFDLPNYVISKLEKLNIKIDYISDEDTYSNPIKYPSHRFSSQKGEKYQGSILSVIMKKL
jgi:YfiH family protein